jgi:hypothetical protein
VTGPVELNRELRFCSEKVGYSIAHGMLSTKFQASRFSIAQTRP